MRSRIFSTSLSELTYTGKCQESTAEHAGGDGNRVGVFKPSASRKKQRPLPTEIVGMSFSNVVARYNRFQCTCVLFSLLYSPQNLVPGSHRVLVDGDTSEDTSKFKCQVVRRSRNEYVVASAALGISFFFQIVLWKDFGPVKKEHIFKRTLGV